MTIAILVLAQGGFFSLAACLCGVVVCVVASVAWLRNPRRDRGLPIVPLLFLGVAAAYLVSALVNGASLTTLSEAGVWAACAGFSFLSAAQDSTRRAFWIKVLTWFGVATAAAGVILCSGTLSIVDGVLGERLQFTFQYANAAAAWYGTCALLCLLSPDKRLQSFAALPVASLILTESGGGLLVFAAVAMVVGFFWARSAQWGRLLQALLQGLVAALLFAFVHFTMSPLSLAGLALAVLACWWLWRYSNAKMLRLDPHIASLVVAGVLALLAIAGVALLPDRVADALFSANERLHHVQDGLALWATQPILGVGPDNWQYLYLYTQAAPYYTAVVHCSYIQVLLDAGIAGLGFFAAACILGMRAHVNDWGNPNARGGWVLAEFVAAAFLLVHAAIDFDFQFASLAYMLAFILSAPNGPVAHAKVAKGLLAGLACVLVCLPACAVGSVCALTASALEVADATGEYGRCEQMFLASPLAQADVGAQSHYLSACYNQGKYEVTCNVYQRLLAPTDGDVLNMALACYALNDRAQATAVLIERLENHPYDAEFLASAEQICGEHGIDPVQNARFNAAANQVRLNVVGRGGNE